MLVLLGLGMTLPWPAWAEKSYRTYVVVPGDSCWSIAERVFGRGSAYKVIHKHNKLGPLPHVLTPGQVIRLPGKQGAPEATVDWLRNEVRAKRPQTLKWNSARRDMGLWKLYKVSTGDESSAGIEFEDESHLRLRQNALLVIYGASATRSRLGKRTKTKVVLERGTLRGGLAALRAGNKPTAEPSGKVGPPGKVEPPDPVEPPALVEPPQVGSSITVETPAARVVLESNEAQVEVSETQMSIVSVYDGQAKVSAQGSSVTVPTGHGTFVEPKKKPAKPRPLPPRPTWGEGMSDSVVLVPRGRRGAFEARWKAVKRAGKYRVELARDPRFRQTITDAVVGAGIVRFAARDLKPGEYFARVAAIDSRRLEGRPSRPLRVRVLEVDSSRLLQPAKSGWEAVGLLRLALTEAQADGLEWRVGEHIFGPASTPIRLATPGAYRVEIRPSGGAVSRSFDIRLLRVVGAIGAPAEVQPGTRVEVTLHLTDEKMRPAQLPGVRMFPTGLPPVAMEAKNGPPGVLVGQLRIPSGHPGGPVTIQAGWLGGPLAKGEVRVRRPEAPAPLPTVGFEWPLVPPGLELYRSAAGLPMRSARPVSRLGISAFAAGSADAPLLRFGVAGELALGRWGFEAELPVFQADPTSDSVRSNELGDARLGFRYLALDRAGVALAPSLRLLLPTGAGAQGRVRFEPGVLLDYQVLSRLVVFTNQVTRIDTDFGDVIEFGYAGSYGLNYRPAPWFSVGVELDTAWEDGRFGLGASAAVWFHLGRLRIGLGGGAGLGESGRALLGDFTAGLTADVGFD